VVFAKFIESETLTVKPVLLLGSVLFTQKSFITAEVCGIKEGKVTYRTFGKTK
jgi:hypothetical protein